jgi:hypothetical protein
VTFAVWTAPLKLTVLPAAVAVRVVIVDVPPILRTPVELLVSPPAPVRPVVTESVPVFVYVPVTATFGKEVVVDPLMVLADPLKLCEPVLVPVNVAALFVKFPVKAKRSFAVEDTSIHEEPLLSVTSPVNVI